MAMASQFREGALAEIFGVSERLVDPSEGTPFDANGKNVQLLEFNSADQTWSAITFDGLKVQVGKDNLKLLEARALAGLDLVAGPKSDEAALLEATMDELVLKGYCVTQGIVPHAAAAQMRSAADQVTYSRVPEDFEPYYLGRDSKEKTTLIDFDALETPREVVNSPLLDQDSKFQMLCASLSPQLEDRLGIRITSRTNLMLRQTFKDDDEEAEYPAPAESTGIEKESFLSLMKRKRVCVMQFLGPLTGILTLTPKGVANAEEIDIQAVPGRMVTFLTESYSYSFTCPIGQTTTLQTWFLGQRPEFSLGDIGGDMQVLGGQSEGANPPPGETVVVNGVATCLGGDSKDYACYWLMVAKAGGDTCVETPMTRWDTSVYCYTLDMQAAQVNGVAYTKHQGYVDGIEFFDAKFFGISNNEAASMDPNQRKCLEVTYEALTMGGYELKQLQRTPQNIGAFVGVSGSEWGQVPHPQDSAGCGGAEAIIANRVNFSLNLKGSSQTLNTACSAGLVAMHTAKLHLKYKDFDPLDGVLAAGVQLAYSPGPFIGCCSGGMLSFKGRCFTFDLSGDGYLRGEGASAVFMQNAPYSREVFSCVAGSQSNQDGRSASITAPNGPSQEKCIKAAFREAGLKPPEVDCFECHGTGTALGDPIEVGAFKRIYNAQPREHALLVTTSKTNLGHLEGGAGMAGFIKCCLQTMRAEAAPNLHLRETNPHLDTEGFPAQFITEGLVFEYDSGYAGVSSFGFGGTNAHAMSYGKNTTTSRGLAQRGASYYRGRIRDKIAQAAPPDIMMFSEDPDDWETNGMPVSEDKIGKIFQVEIQEGGKAVWREVVEEPDSNRGERFYLSGSFNYWGMDRMMASDDIPGLYSCEVEIGETGAELFAIMADEDPGLMYYPAEPQTTRKASDIVGPEAVVGDREDCTWCIVGNPGTRYTVEFFCSEFSKSVNWLRIPPAELQA